MRFKTIIMVLILIAGSTNLRLSAQTLPEGYPKTDRQKECINTGWRFHLGDPEAGYYKTTVNDSDWKLISVPHTLELTSMSLNDCNDDKTQETFQRDVGWYRRNIFVGEDQGQKVFLEFEGAHQVTDLWVNGKHVGQYAVGGYTPFHFDITDYVRFNSDNQVTLLVDNRRREDVPPDPGPFDYIKFSGLYRDVYLVQTNPVHVTFNWEALDAGVFITTPSVDPVNMNATILVKSVLRNDGGETANTELVTRVIDADGLVVLKLKQKAEIDPGRDHVFQQVGGIEDDMHLWSLDDPYLYRVNTMVLVNDKAVDCLENPLGIRKLELDPDGGFVLNGKPVKLIGTNRHQHYGFIGDAMPNSLHYKDVLQIKELGMNVIRTAHYPQDNALLDACDKLGVLVYEEAPTWISIGSEAWFDNLERAARTMVRNHRNHPSVIIWGAGINHRGSVPRSQYAIKQEDPMRFTASQSSRWTGWQSSGLADIYAQMVYGEYYWSEDEHVFAMEGGRTPSAVNEVMDHPMKLGLISWTAHAYYTFHSNDNPKDRSRSGLMTVFRYPRPGLMWFKSELTAEPFLYVENEWKPGIEELIVYSNSEEVQVLLDGNEIARSGPGEQKEYANLHHPPFHIPIRQYEKGEVTVNGLTKGEVVATQQLLTPGKPYAIKLELDSAARKFTADGSDIVVAYANVLDKNGTIVEDADIMVTFSVDGPAKIVGDGEGIDSNPFGTTYGVAPALIQAGTTPGKIRVKAYAKGLKSDEVLIESIANETDMILAGAKPIYDFEKIQVDIGEYKQLVQFGWIPWNNADNSSSRRQFTELGGFSASLAAAENQNLLRWLGEINVMGKHAYAFGEGVLCMDKKGLVLKFEGLKKGNYKLVTYHHAPRSGTDSMDPNQELKVTATIFKLPYAEELAIEISDAKGSATTSTNVSFGKDMHDGGFGACEIIFESDGENPVELRFSDPKGEKGVWLNAFELGEWY